MKMGKVTFQRGGRLVNKYCHHKVTSAAKEFGPNSLEAGRANLSLPICRLGGAKEMTAGQLSIRLKARNTVVANNEQQWHRTGGVPRLLGLDLGGNSAEPLASTGSGGAGYLPSGADPQLRRR